MRTLAAVAALVLLGTGGTMAGADLLLPGPDPGRMFVAGIVLLVVGALIALGISHEDGHLIRPRKGGQR